MWNHTNHKREPIDQDDLDLDNEDIDSEMFGELKNEVNEKIDMMKQFIAQSINYIAEDCSQQITKKL